MGKKLHKRKSIKPTIKCKIDGPLIRCKLDGLIMEPHYGVWSGDLYYQCSAKGMFSKHYRERIVYVGSLPEKTQNQIMKPKQYKLGKNKEIRI